MSVPSSNTVMNLLFPGLLGYIGRSAQDGCEFSLIAAHPDSDITIKGWHPNGWEIQQTLVLRSEIKDDTYKTKVSARMKRFVACFPAAAAAEARVC